MDDVASLIKAGILLGCGVLFSKTWNTLSVPGRQRKYITLPHHFESWDLDVVAKLKTKVHNFDDLQSFYDDDIPRFFKNYLYPQHTGEESEEEIKQREALIEDFFENLFPFIQSMALKLPSLFSYSTNLWYLVANQEDEIVLSREQICCLLANAFFSTFPIILETDEDSQSERETDGADRDSEEETGFNFDALLRSSLGSAFNSCLCILNYFRRFQENPLKGNVVFKRQLLDPEKTPDWDNSEKKISKVTILDTGSIETDQASEFHAVFSNKWIGGGLLHAGGYAQEEMAFVLRPECIVSLLLCPGSEQMEDNEAVIISGAECFSDHCGYGVKFKYSGDFRENRPIYEPTNSLSLNVVCVDALSCTGNLTQFEDKNIHRELCKLYAGVYNWQEKTENKQNQVYATSHWGCGINGGNRQLKAIEQLLSLSEAGLDVHYYTYDSPTFSQSFGSLAKFLNDLDASVGEVASALFLYKEKRMHHPQQRQTLFEHIIEYLALIRKRGTSSPVTRGILRRSTSTSNTCSNVTQIHNTNCSGNSTTHDTSSL